MTDPGGRAPCLSPRSPCSGLLRDHIAAIKEASRLGPVIDLACGGGRHVLALEECGITSIGLDRSRDRLRELSIAARHRGFHASVVRTDLETPHGIPLRAASCGVVLVFRFLHRPLMPAIEACLKPGGLLLYETFSIAHLGSGRGPRREAFYLGHDELPGLFPGLEIVHHEEGPNDGPQPDITARLVARKPIAPGHPS